MFPLLGPSRALRIGSGCAVHDPRQRLPQRTARSADAKLGTTWGVGSNRSPSRTTASARGTSPAGGSVKLGGNSTLPTRMWTSCSPQAPTSRHHSRHTERRVGGRGSGLRRGETRRSALAPANRNDRWARERDGLALLLRRGRPALEGVGGTQRPHHRGEAPRTSFDGRADRRLFIRPCTVPIPTRGTRGRNGSSGKSTVNRRASRSTFSKPLSAPLPPPHFSGAAGRSLLGTTRPWRSRAGSAGLGGWKNLP